MKIKTFALPPLPAVLLAIISVQCGAAIAKTLFPEIGAIATASLRIGISAIILLAVYRPKLSQLSSNQWKLVVPYGLSLGAMNLIFYLAIERIPIGLAVTLEFIGPLMVAILGSRRAVDFIWVTFAAAGILLIAPWTNSNVDLLGAGLAVLAGLLWAGYIVLGGRVSKVMDSGSAVATGMLFASLLILPFAIFNGKLTTINPGHLGLGFALALLSSAIPFTLEMKALGQLPARTFSILMSLEPAAASLCGLLFLHEYLSFNETLAVVFVIVASAGSTVTARRVENS
ncbi:threonine transporter RhtB [Flavobacterium noncentrifugens]|uniref:Inner membrane transporter RhtA n=1 Tax=Flavobacterium noncentrifugens TaxID=1128970 RepID=A0A1G8ZR23_9FLAO|nr:DMT family transporter [Flavobacterium noncentrifugens]GEP51881.1 threonine transporter RhtB [Flavobacterium noncentrifugens]SDK17034.1 inner membrane transporter RhtA [Flavobacterium noncentrifugens]